MKISEVQVLHSNAGYYIGTSYYDNECGCWFPNERLSDYYRSFADAEKDLVYYKEV